MKVATTENSHHSMINEVGIIQTLMFGGGGPQTSEEGFSARKRMGPVSDSESVGETRVD